MKSIIYLVLLIVYSFAAPASKSEDTITVTKYVDSSSTAYDWSRDWIKSYPIHKSCNDTQYNQLSAALEDVQLLAAHARDHTLRYGNESEFYRKYFGNAPTGEVVGIFENVVSADKSTLLFRCDDIDGNCKNDGWAGHWRGENATDETVICDLSYTSRLFLSQMCSQGYTVAGSKNTVYWAGDLLHRIWHTDSLGQRVVGHYADTYEECLELATKKESQAVRNSATLRYYALDVYAFDIAIPGKGCSGSSKKSSSKESTSTTVTASGSEETHTSGSECHTHANGETHCA